MSLSVGTSLAAQALPLQHTDASLPDAAADGQRLAGCNSRSEWCLPETNDEVLIAFEGGQLRSPFVAAPLWNSTDEPPQHDAAAERKHPDLQTRLPSLMGSMSTQTRGDLASHIKGLEEKLNSAGDGAQLANVDLQNCLQRQQQTLQMVSNISKVLYDTALAIIRKIGG